MGGVSRFASEASRAAPRRPWRGETPSSDGRLVYAIGDIHGCFDLLLDLLGRIAADLRRQGDRIPTVVFCGDYIDRGPDSARVLDALVWLTRWGGWDVRLLKGNHEQAVLQFLDEPHRGAGWLSFGGEATLRSYGVEPPTDGEAMLRARDELLAVMPAAHLRLLQQLELQLTIGDYAFVHAGVAPRLPLARQSEQDLLWIRDEFLEETRPFERIIVHGHTWVDDRPTIRPNRLGVDTGAYMTGVLTALRIEDGRHHPIQTRDPEVMKLVPEPPDYVRGAGAVNLVRRATQPVPRPGRLRAYRPAMSEEAAS